MNRRYQLWLMVNGKAKLMDSHLTAAGAIRCAERSYSGLPALVINTATGNRIWSHQA